MRWASIASSTIACLIESVSTYGTSAETRLSAPASGRGLAAASRSANRTPVHCTSGTDQPVTQTKSETWVRCGRASRSRYVSSTGLSTRPSMRSRQLRGSKRGIGEDTV